MERGREREMKKRKERDEEDWKEMRREGEQNEW